MAKSKKEGIPKSVSEYMASLGKRGGATNKKKGRAYFQWIRAHAKKKQVTK